MDTVILSGEEHSKAFIKKEVDKLLNLSKRKPSILLNEGTLSNKDRLVFKEVIGASLYPIRDDFIREVVYRLKENKRTKNIFKWVFPKNNKTVEVNELHIRILGLESAVFPFNPFFYLLGRDDDGNLALFPKEIDKIHTLIEAYSFSRKKVISALLNMYGREKNEKIISWLSKAEDAIKEDEKHILRLIGKNALTIENITELLSRSRFALELRNELFAYRIHKAAKRYGDKYCLMAVVGRAHISALYDMLLDNGLFPMILGYDEELIVRATALKQIKAKRTKKQEPKGKENV